jgi:hypothetical protein
MPDAGAARNCRHVGDARRGAGPEPGGGQDPADRPLPLLLPHARQLALDPPVTPAGVLESTDTGHPLRDIRLLDVPRTASTYRYFGGLADKYQGSLVPVDRGYLKPR